MPLSPIPIRKSYGPIENVIRQYVNPVARFNCKQKLTNTHFSYPVDRPGISHLGKSNPRHLVSREQGDTMLNKQRLMLLLSGITLLIPGVGFAAQGQRILEEIIVTAEKRQSNVQDTPLAISVGSLNGASKPACNSNKPSPAVKHSPPIAKSSFGFHDKNTTSPLLPQMMMMGWLCSQPLLEVLRRRGQGYQQRQH